MRAVWGAVLIVMVSGPLVWAQSDPSAEMDVRAQAAAGAVLNSFGSGEQLNANGMQPLSTDKPMHTVDGSKQFNAQTSCEASSQFMRVTILPNATSDIQTITLDLDPHFTGAVTQSSVFNGPFAAVCNNGVVQCDANSFNNCHYDKWQADVAAGTIGLTEVGPEQLGACYCFNNSCGNNLLWVNSGKVLSDLGNGINLELNRIFPRLSVGRSQQLDAVTLVFYGQNASCGVDSSPEQYFSHAQDLPAAGLAARDQPGSVSAFIASTPAAAGTSASSIECNINRSVALDEVTRDGILSLLSMTRGQWMSAQPAVPGGLPSCDPSNCIDFLIGDPTEKTYIPTSACGLFQDSALLNVARPDRVVSAKLLATAFDDYGQVWVDGSLVFGSDPRWVGSGPYPAPSCELGRTSFAYPGTDVTARLLGAGPTVKLEEHAAVAGWGDGAAYFEVRVNPGCAVGAETIEDGCIAAEHNTDCGVWEEWVDGVQTVRDGLTTGLSPLPSAKTLVGSTCSVSTGNRNWWTTRRIYQCVAHSSDYDFSNVLQRRDAVVGSLDGSSGSYTDRLVNADGTVSTPSGKVSLPAPRATACQQTCKTRAPRPGDAVGPSGPQSRLNATGVQWSFHYKNCTADSICPLDAGEEVVSACDCQSNFAEAAAMMQTIRMVAEDQTCSP
jgi:hypothetical protein